MLNMIEQNDCKKTAVRKRASPQVIFSNKELQPITNYNVPPVNCEQDWKASGHCSISVVSSRNNLPRTIMIVSHIAIKTFQQPGNSPGMGSN